MNEQIADDSTATPLQTEASQNSVLTYAERQTFGTLEQLQKIMPDAPVKALAKLLGAPRARLVQDARCYGLGLLYRSQLGENIHLRLPNGQIFFRYEDWPGLLGKLSRLQAFRIFGYFPDPILGPKSLERDGDYDYRSMYIGGSFWLINDALNLGLENHLRSSGLGPYEDFYLLLDQRYRLINRLVMMDEVLDTQMSPLIWLLVEASLSEKRFTNTQELLETGQKISKNDLSEEYNNYIQGLEKKDLVTVSVSSDDELMRCQWATLDAWARETADLDKTKTFEKVFFKPYLAALRNWNRKKKKLHTPVAPGKPGPSLGSQPKRKARRKLGDIVKDCKDKKIATE